jgi:predicted metalloprotease
MTTTGETFNQVRSDLERAEESRRAQVAAMLDIQAACLAGDWARAEEARLRAIGALEAHLDHLIAAHRAIKGA